MQQAAKDEATGKIIGQTSDLAKDVGALAKFCVMAGWFIEQSSNFDT